MKPSHIDDRSRDPDPADRSVREQTRRLGRQYGEDYFAQYGRGPYSYETGVPYRHGEPLWQTYFDQIATLIVSESAPRTVLDAGCAIGFLVQALREREVEAWGIDISEYAIGQVPEKVRAFCWAGSVTDELDHDYDLVVCMEVLEHLSPHLAPITVANFSRHADRVLFSASPDGFRDPTHLNVQPTDYWVELFGRHGFFRDLDVDASVVAPQAIYFVRAGQTAVSVARAYERWHWNTLAELRDLRAARKIGNDAVERAKRYEAEIAAIDKRLDSHKRVARRRANELKDAVERAKRYEAEIAALDQRLVERAKRYEAEIAALDQRLDSDKRAAERSAAALDELLESHQRLDSDKRAAEQRAAALDQLLENQRRVAGRSEAELAALQRTRRFRYPARVRGLYARARAIPQIEGAAAPREASEGAVQYSVDAPSPGHIVEPDLLVHVHGWVICKHDPVARIQVYVNGTDFGRARISVARPDVGADFDAPEAPMSGFETVIDLATLPAGTNAAKIELTVETLGGDRHSLDPVVVWPATPNHDETPNTRDVSEFRMPRQEHPLPAIRLLVFTHQLGLGGGQLYLFELLRLLSRSSDFSATILSPADGPLREPIEELGIPLVITGSHPVSTLAEYEAQQERLVSWARDGFFNSVLANTLGSFPGVDLAARLDLPALWAIHESFDLKSFWRAGYGSFDAVHSAVKSHAEQALQSAAAVVFEADATRELFVRHGEPSRFVTVPYGIDIEEIERFAASVSRAEARKRLQLPTDATILLCLGTVEPRKAQGMLAAAFNGVAGTYSDAMLVFVGAGSDAPSTGLQSFVSRLGLANKVRIMPVTPDIYLWYRAADAFICASDVESLPRTVLESMAFSVPVLATRVFGLPELIEDGVTGYLCEPRDTDELMRLLTRFLSSTTEERQAVGSAGAELVRERHDSRGYAAEYHRLLRALIQDPTRSPSAILADDPPVE
jgi:glycosyltransferase involved in cell wall biosynthesis/SAM-dependent methyltransferase